MLFFFFIGLCKSLDKKYETKQELRAALLKLSLLKRPQIMSLFFKLKVHSARNKAPRYDDGASTFVPACDDIEIFGQPSQCHVQRGCRDLSIEEYKVAFLYILTNIPQMEEFLKYVFILLK